MRWDLSLFNGGDTFTNLKLDRDLLIWLWNLMGIQSEHVMAVMSYQNRHYKHNTIYTFLNDRKQIAL